MKLSKLNFKFPVSLKNKAVLGAFCIVAAIVIGFGNNPMVGMTVACAVAVSQAL